MLIRALNHNKSINWCGSSPGMFGFSNVGIGCRCGIPPFSTSSDERQAPKNRNNNKEPALSFREHRPMANLHIKSFSFWETDISCIGKICKEDIGVDKSVWTFALYFGIE